MAQTVEVSASAVLLVLSGKGCIPNATGERVSQTIEQPGFMRNRQAASLCGGQNGVIGLIVNNLSRPFYAELVAGFTDVLERQGKVAFLAQGGRSGGKIDQRFDTLAAQGVDGVIIARSADRGNELRERAVQTGVPLAFAPRASYLDDIDLIRPDNMQAAQLITERLTRRSHQWTAWPGGQSSSPTRARRVGGYYAILLKYGLPFRSEWVLECESNQKQAAEAMVGLLCQNPTITTVLCYNNVMATGTRFGLLRTGRRGGEDGVESYFEQQVALTALANVPEAALDDLPLTWVTTPVYKMGKILAESMLRRLEEGTGEARNQIIPSRLVTRKWGRRRTVVAS